MSVVEIIQRNALSSLLLLQGYNVFLPVTDQGIDFIIHRECDDALRLVQQKSRWTIDRKYLGRAIWVAFLSREVWYMAPHDEMVELERRKETTLETRSWRDNGQYHRANLSHEDALLYEPYRLRADLGECTLEGVR